MSPKGRRHYSLAAALIFSNKLQLRGDVKIIWLQPPYSAASCSQFMKEKLYITWNAAEFWLQPVLMSFDVSPYLFVMLPLRMMQHFGCNLRLGIFTSPLSTCQVLLMSNVIIHVISNPISLGRLTIAGGGGLRILHVHLKKC